MVGELSCFGILLHVYLHQSNIYARVNVRVSEQEWIKGIRSEHPGKG